MARLLAENDWFEPLAPNGIVDTAYEDVLLARADVLFPGFLAVRHHYVLTNDRGHVTPHFVLIDRHYRSWWVVLLQTGKSPPASYFQTVAEVLRAHPYGHDDARILAERNLSIDVAKLGRLMKNEMPKLYAIIGHPPPPPLTSSDIRIGIAELFRSGTGREILRVNGEHPRQPEERIGTCTRDSVVQRGLLKLSLREGVDFGGSFRCEIEVEGSLASWTLRQNDKDIWLVAPAGVTLPIEVDIFSLIRYGDGRLELVRHTS